MDKKQKNLLIGGSIMTGVIVMAIGIGVAVLNKEPNPNSNSSYANNTPLLQQAAEQPGAVSIEPMQIAMNRAASGEIQGMATISALFQDFNATNLTINDPRYTWTSDCIGPNQILAAGSRCNVIITFTEAPNGTAFAADPNAPLFLTINGQSKTPGGSLIPVESKGGLIPFNSNGIPDYDPNSPPIITSGSPAPVGIDPYGPAPADAGVAPPMNYSQAPIPPSQPTLTPQEQFLLARRQAVFGGMRPSAQATAPKKQGTWDELGLTSSTSSYAQDMSRVLTQDRIITAVLVRNYDSRGAQQVTAQVDRNVYGAHGRNILIPRGSTLIGQASGGGERVAINWTQLIRPDGGRFKLQATSGDAMGQLGVPGIVNERLGKRYGAILLGTAFTAGAALASNAEETAGGSFGEGGRNKGAIAQDAIRQDVQKIVNDIVQKKQAITAIVTVPAGTRITVVPMTDLVLRPLTGPEIQATSYPRAQNAGAPAPQFVVNTGQNSENQGNQYSQNNGIVVDQNAGSPLPAAEVPPVGSTPPWGSN